MALEIRAAGRGQQLSGGGESLPALPQQSARDKRLVDRFRVLNDEALSLRPVFNAAKPSARGSRVVEGMHGTLWECFGMV